MPKKSLTERVKRLEQAIQPQHQIQRRGFLMLTGAAASAAALGTLPQPATAQPELDEFNELAVLIGTTENRPSPDGDFINNYDEYNFQYLATDTGARYTIQTNDNAWTEVPTLPVTHQFSELPTSPALGTIAFDEDHGTPAWWDSDHWEWPNFVDDVLTTPVTVADTTTRTTVFDPDINPDSLIEGRTYQLDLFGKFSTANNSDTFTVDINLASDTDVAGVANTGGNVTDAPWSVEFTFTVRAHGQNGVLQPHTRGLFNSEPADSHHGTVSVDTTTVTELSVDIQWSAADPANSATLGQAHLKQMG